MKYDVDLVFIFKEQSLLNIFIPFEGFELTIFFPKKDQNCSQTFSVTKEIRSDFKKICILGNYESEQWKYTEV